jgi:acyl carrier protein
MTTISSIRRIPASDRSFNIPEIRALIAEHLDADIERVTDDAHFIDDLGADWLDHLELMIKIEDRFAGLELTKDDADQIKVVGDLIRYIGSWVNGGRSHGGSRPIDMSQNPTKSDPVI